MSRPLLSVVVVADGEEAVAELLEHLRRQTAADRVETVLVGPRGALGASRRDGSLAVRVVEVEGVVPLSEARARGVRAAGAPWVVVGETHAFPEPAWAAALIDACQAGATVAVPVIESGNGGLISWSNFVLSYAPWSKPSARGLARIPEQTAVVPREQLLAFGEELPWRLETGSGFGEALLRRGARPTLVTAARLRHLNVSSPRAWLPERFAGGRVYGATRSRPWSIQRRLLHVVAAPLGAAVFLFRAVRTAAALSCWPERRLLAVPALALGVAAWVAGETLAYLAGAGGAEEDMAEYEINRRRYLARGPDVPAGASRRSSST